MRNREIAVNKLKNASKSSAKEAFHEKQEMYKLAAEEIMENIQEQKEVNKYRSFITFT